MKEELQEYNLISTMSIETKDEYRQQILEELTDALIEIVEKYDSFCGGGFSLLPYEKFVAPESKL